MTGFTIRRPRDVEGPVCRMLLPEATTGERKHDLLVAVQPANPPIVGAIAWIPSPGVFGGLRLRVVRTHRRQGIASAMLAAVLEEAQRVQGRQLFARVDQV